MPLTPSRHNSCGSRACVRRQLPRPLVDDERLRALTRRIMFVKLVKNMWKGGVKRSSDRWADDYVLFLHNCVCSLIRLRRRWWWWWWWWGGGRYDCVDFLIRCVGDDDETLHPHTSALGSGISRIRDYKTRQGLSRTRDSRKDCA